MNAKLQRYFLSPKTNLQSDLSPGGCHGTLSKMTYWDGAAADRRMCACGIKGTCAKGDKSRCNCDANDKKWREDSGLLTNKIHLPVKQLKFGDTDLKHEEGCNTLGKFKCYGTA